MSGFKHQALRELTEQQVRYTPAGKRIEQIGRAERLLAEIDPAKVYPYQYVCYRITEYRPETYPDLIIPGDELQHDLHLFVSRLAGSIPAVPVESYDEPVLSLEELSQQLNVATKTIHRWRKRGLPALRVINNGRQQIGFLPSLIEPFLEANAERVAKSRRFSQMSEEEKEQIIAHARRLAQVPGTSLMEVSRRIADWIGRSTEAVRYTIKNFDRENPDQALFPEVTGQLDPETKELIYESYRRGIAVKTLAKRFRRTPGSVYRVINEARARRLLEQPLDYIYHESFDDPAQEEAIMAPMPGQEEFEQAKAKMRAPKDVPPELASLYEMPLLTKEQEQHLFRKMNFLKHKANLLRAKLILPSGRIDVSKLKVQDLDEIEQLQKEANEIKELLINCNMRLVASIAKRHVSPTKNLFELMSDGNVSLIRSVEKFDFSRGNKFSTYASWAIMKNFARSIPEEKTRLERFSTGHEQVFEIAPDTRTNERECIALAEQASEKVNRMLEYLDPRERQVIRMRAGLDDDAEPMTLDKIGERLGLTKERVRQLNVRAMRKLRHLAKFEKDEF